MGKYTGSEMFCHCLLSCQAQEDFNQAPWCPLGSDRAWTQHPIPKSGRRIFQLCWPVQADLYQRPWVCLWGHISLVRGSSLLWSASLLWCVWALSWQQDSPGNGVTCGWWFLNITLDSYYCWGVAWSSWWWCGVCFTDSSSTDKFHRTWIVF